MPRKEHDVEALAETILQRFNEAGAVMPRKEGVPVFDHEPYAELQ